CRERLAQTDRKTNAFGADRQARGYLAGRGLSGIGRLGLGDRRDALHFRWFSLKQETIIHSAATFVDWRPTSNNVRSARRLGTAGRSLLGCRFAKQFFVKMR